MGVHDYSCAIYSKERDGDQCLQIPQKSNINQNEDINDEPVNNNEIDFSEDEWEENIFTNGVGCSKAYLEIFVFPDTLNVSLENFNDMVRDKKYEKRYFDKYEYSWDSWDFSSRDGDEQELNYRESFDESGIIWKVQEGEFVPHLLTENPGKDIWIRNFSPQAYKFYINSEVPHPKMLNIDLCYVCYLFDVDYRTLTRAEAFLAVKAKIKDVFGF
jgi:hypothetical protein